MKTCLLKRKITGKIRKAPASARVSRGQHFVDANYRNLTKLALKHESEIAPMMERKFDRVSSTQASQNAQTTKALTAFLKTLQELPSEMKMDPTRAIARCDSCFLAKPTVKCPLRRADTTLCKKAVACLQELKKMARHPGMFSAVCDVCCPAIFDGDKPWFVTAENLSQDLAHAFEISTVYKGGFDKMAGFEQNPLAGVEHFFGKLSKAEQAGILKDLALKTRPEQLCAALLTHKAAPSPCPSEPILSDSKDPRLVLHATISELTKQIGLAEATLETFGSLSPPERLTVFTRMAYLIGDASELIKLLLEKCQPSREGLLSLQKNCRTFLSAGVPLPEDIVKRSVELWPEGKKVEFLSSVLSSIGREQSSAALRLSHPSLINYRSMSRRTLSIDQPASPKSGVKSKGSPLVASRKKLRRATSFSESKKPGSRWTVWDE